MNYLWPLIAASVLIVLIGSAWAYVWWRDRRELKEFERRYKAQTEGAYWLGKDGTVMHNGKAVHSPVDSIDSPQPKP